MLCSCHAAGLEVVSAVPLTTVHSYLNDFALFSWAGQLSALPFSGASVASWPDCNTSSICLRYMFLLWATSLPLLSVCLSAGWILVQVHV